MPGSHRPARAQWGCSSTGARPRQAARAPAVLTRLCPWGVLPVLAGHPAFRGDLFKKQPSPHSKRRELLQSRPRHVPRAAFLAPASAPAAAFLNLPFCALDVAQPATVQTQGQVNDENRRPQRRRSGNSCRHLCSGPASHPGALCLRCACFCLGPPRDALSPLSP